MWLTVLGGSGGVPADGIPCSGYLVEHDGFRLLVDPGYGTSTALLRHCRSDEVDAVYVSHGHPDHCADLNPLLRMRVHGQNVRDENRSAPPPPLPIFCQRGSVDAVLALEPGAMLEGSYLLREFDAGDAFPIASVAAATRALPHFVSNAGVRLSVGGRSLTYTGDCAPSDALVDLAYEADLLVAEATYVDRVAERHQGHLNDARTAGRIATQANVARLMLVHLWPGTNHDDARRAASYEYEGPIDVARPRLVVQV